MLNVLQFQSVQGADAGAVGVLGVSLVLVGKGNLCNGCIFFTVLTDIYIEIMRELTKVELHFPNILRLCQMVDNTRLSFEPGLCAGVPHAVNIAVIASGRADFRHLGLIHMPFTRQLVGHNLQLVYLVGIFKLRHFGRAVPQPCTDAADIVDTHPGAVVLRVTALEQQLYKGDILGIRGVQSKMEPVTLGLIKLLVVVLGDTLQQGEFLAILTYIEVKENFTGAEDHLPAIHIEPAVQQIDDRRITQIVVTGCRVPLRRLFVIIGFGGAVAVAQSCVIPKAQHFRVPDIVGLGCGKLDLLRLCHTDHADGGC